MLKQELAKYIECYGRDIYSFCFYLTGNRLEADDLYQDTWMKVVEKLSEIEEGEKVKSYCLSVALRLWKNKKRKFAWRRRIAPFQSYEDISGQEYIQGEADSPEETLIDREKKESVWAAVSSLPDKLRLIVVLYYMENLSHAQISEILSIPAGTVKSRLHEARKQLKSKLKGVLE